MIFLEKLRVIGLPDVAFVTLSIPFYVVKKHKTF